MNRARLLEPNDPHRIEALGWSVSVPRAVGIYTRQFTAKKATCFSRIVTNVRGNGHGVFLDSISIAGRNELTGELPFGALSAAEYGTRLTRLWFSSLAAGDVMNVKVEVKETPEAYELFKIGIINASHLAYGLGKEKCDYYQAFFEGCQAA